MFDVVKPTFHAGENIYVFEVFNTVEAQAK